MSRYASVFLSSMLLCPVSLNRCEAMFVSAAHDTGAVVMNSDDFKAGCAVESVVEGDGMTLSTKLDVLRCSLAEIGFEYLVNTRFGYVRHSLPLLQSGRSAIASS